MAELHVNLTQKRIWLSFLLARFGIFLLDPSKILFELKKKNKLMKGYKDHTIRKRKTGFGVGHL